MSPLAENVFQKNYVVTRPNTNQSLAGCESWLFRKKRAGSQLRKNDKCWRKRSQHNNVSFGYLSGGIFFYLKSLHARARKTNFFSTSADPSNQSDLYKADAGLSEEEGFCSKKMMDVILNYRERAASIADGRRLKPGTGLFILSHQVHANETVAKWRADVWRLTLCSFEARRWFRFEGQSIKWLWHPWVGNGWLELVSAGGFAFFFYHCILSKDFK